MPILVSDADRQRHYVCGCVNEIHQPSGVLRSVGKCDGHRAAQREVGLLEQDYYASLGVFMGGIPKFSRYLKELRETLGPFPDAADGCPITLEIGCGVSPYAGELIRLGHSYTGVEPSGWAALWMMETYGVVVECKPFEHFEHSPCLSLILAAHSLEHMADAPGAIARAASMLEPGGEFWIIVPDDSDPVNPDHLWMFNTTTLRACLERAGLVVEAMEVRKRIERENFIYCRARKPA